MTIQNSLEEQKQQREFIVQTMKNLHRLFSSTDGWEDLKDAISSVSFFPFSFFPSISFFLSAFLFSFGFWVTLILKQALTTEKSKSPPEVLN